jgi:hypothetical protein
MYKNTKMVAPDILTAGTFLLTACDVGATAAGQTPPPAADNTTTADSPSDGSTSGGGGGKADAEVAEGSVDCGRHPLNNGRFGTHRLVVDPGIDGLVGCDVALDVVEEYLAAGNIRVEGTEVSKGWDCAATFEGEKSEGEIVSIFCYLVPKNETRSGWAYQFSTELLS